jgi:ribonucleoside-diphosphate reductase alpha chain
MKETEESKNYYHNASQTLRPHPSAKINQVPANEDQGDVRLLTRDPSNKLDLSPNALYLLKQRYLIKNEGGETIETPLGMMRRVASALAAVEPTIDGQKFWEQKFYEIMTNMEFHPGSRVLANAGTTHPQLGNCFVFPLADSQRQIFQTLYESSLIKSYGGGCGFNYSEIRPRGDIVRKTPGLALGPVQLMHIFDMTTTMFKQQGRYESGNMAVLNVDHADVFEFIAAKECDGALSFTNTSLGVSDAFMQAVVNDDSWKLYNPRTREVVRSVSARTIFQEACLYASKTGDPGLLFIDRINESNPLVSSFGPINATNPCGEIALYPYESCNLGYINLTRFLLAEEDRTLTQIFDILRLQAAVTLGVRMVDNAISASWSPIEEIDKATKANRRIGIGITGWADCLAVAGIPYDSDEALKIAEHLAEVMYTAAYRASVALGREKAPFPNAERSMWRDVDDKPRNVALLGFPPSGNNAIIFDTAFSIEPFFAMSFTENVMGEGRIHHINDHLYNKLHQAGIPTDGLLGAIEEGHGSIQHISWIPDSIKACFKTAHDITPEWHVRMQAAFQKYVDNAITKTVNLPSTASAADVERVYTLAWSLGCKGITVYFDCSRSKQAIEFTTSKSEEPLDLECSVCS